MREEWVKKFGPDESYNRYCKHLTESYQCKIKMDMIHCGNRCAYATNVKGSLKVDNKGNVVGLN